MTLHYAQNVRNSGPSNRAPEGVTEEQWHKDAIGDTRTSHTIPGRLYVVQCEWCEEAFAANTKTEALAMFREHEAEMLLAVETPREADATPDEAFELGEVHGYDEGHKDGVRAGLTRAAEIARADVSPFHDYLDTKGHWKSQERIAAAIEVERDREGTE